MDNETLAKPPTPAAGDKGNSGGAPMRRGRGAGFAVLVIMLAMLAALAWWYVDQKMRERDSAREDQLGAKIAELARSNEQLRQDVESLRSRFIDTETMNRDIRGEVLGFNERSRVLEDAVANLADERLSGRDAMAINEAEFILQLAGERLALFHDAAGAIAAYRLADSALAAAEDPLFAAVRQTIQAEVLALEAAQPMQTRATLDQLANLRASLASLPLKSNRAVAPAPDVANRSRFREVLAQFVRISDDDIAPAFNARDAALTRTLAAIDLRTAEAALFARDQEAFTAAIARASTGMRGVLDGDAADVRAALTVLDRLAATPLAPALPDLGTALRELRNLRTTRALALPANVPVTPDGVIP